MIDLGPEAAFVGAVLHLPADAAVQVLDLVHDSDLEDPRLRVVAGVARQLAQSGVAPDPVAVVAHARASGTVTKVEAIKSFTLVVAELYGGCPTRGTA